MVQTMQILLLAALLAAPVSGLSVRQARATAAGEHSNDTSVTPEDIKEKWAKMDDFLEIMFTMSCKWYHGKDINGEAAEKLKAGELTKDNYDDFIKKTQSTNLQDMDQSCGMITANGKATCRSSCIDRWGSNMAERDHCDDSCIAVYDRFAKECQTKVTHLETVYASKLKSTAMKKQCYEGWCPDLPQVWMKDVAAAKEEVDTACTSMCTPTNVVHECQQAYYAEVDFLTANATTTCDAAAKLQSCFEDAQGVAKTTAESCSSTSNSTCHDEFNTCKTKAQTDNSPQEALSFCENRQKQCGIKSMAECASTYEEAIGKGKSDCEAADEVSLKQCVNETMIARETSFTATCKTEKTKTCSDDCQKKCKVDEMQQCLADTKGEDGTEEFCKDFWALLHDSSEVDPATGNPIVMIATKGDVKKASAK